MKVPCFETTSTGATFSPCRTWRYELWLAWGAEPPFVFIGLNPSTADEGVDDPTIRRCIGFAKREGAGGLVMLNLFALRSTDPAALLTHADPVGPDNDRTLGYWFRDPRSRLVAAWGNHKAAKVRAGEVLSWVRPAQQVMRCLGRNKDGSPKHPLYLRADAPLIPLKERDR